MDTLKAKPILIIGVAAVALVLIGGIVGLVLTSSGGDRSGSIQKLALQPNDLPAEFTLSEEKLHSREDIIAKLPAGSQVAEQGLKEAIQRTYVSQEGSPLIDLYVYAYENEEAAAAAQAFASEPIPDELRPLTLVNGMTGFAVHDALQVEGIGDGAFLMTGWVGHDDGDQNTVDETLNVQIYFMHSGSARAELLVAGDNIFLQPETAARNQYLRLERPDLLFAP